MKKPEPLRLALTLSLAVLHPLSVWARPVTIGLAEFRRDAPCGVVGSVVEIRAHEGAGTPRGLDHLARVAVRDVFGADCSVGPGEELKLYFSVHEVHSSQPEVGENAVIFPRLENGRYVEAIYGRSYWPIETLEDKRLVTVTWRNEFLFGMFGLLRGKELALVPLTSIVRLWEGGVLKVPE